MKKYDREHTLFYCDPPYWETEGYGVPFEFEQYLEMARMLKVIKGKAIISLNDHPAIRECFAEFHIETTDIKYTVGGGKGSEAKEVLIFSWDIQAEPAGLFWDFFADYAKGAEVIYLTSAPQFFARRFSLVCRQKRLLRYKPWQVISIVRPTRYARR